MTEIVEINSGRQVVSRQEAKSIGLKFYFTGKPCKWGHAAERYTSSGACVACTAEHNTSDEARATSARWNLDNPDRYAAIMGWNAAKRRGAYLPDDFSSISDLLTATEGFYVEARRLTEESGIPHEVDHRVPFKHHGLHHPGNLRVVTRAFNRSKKSLTDRECLEKILNGSWKGPTDPATISLLISSVQFDAVAAGTMLQIAAVETGTTLKIAA